ncbi:MULTISPECIES: hypothetical protein [unclassified Streptomyces]|uniref:hypothetical protein n=1 Tax=unclassified Streptomyces TaxID=2593676 RepID=UPI001661541C|nr:MULTISPECIES: hypothetical protein [unclassified Streptomyces]MBD0712394.1 hypothetical protein [Streptomyces sp. CBMA291]MBD0716768.1 hypothetical protein [Streptomyces sp. CBMA370]
MTHHDELRLLPWTTLDGKPCFLSTDETGGPLSRLADRTESAQLEAGTVLLDHAMEVIADAETEPEELLLLATALTHNLRDTLRIAVSRGHRLSTPSTNLGGDAEGPRLPAAAFG